MLFVFFVKGVEEGCKGCITSKKTFNSETKGACKLVSGTFGSTKGDFCMDYGDLEEFMMTHTPQPEK